MLIPALQVCEYAQVLKEKKVPCEIHIFDRGGHGFGGCVPSGINPMFPSDLTRVNHWKDLYTSWLKSL
jgi:acetyl esterase/lipase